jgi:hypothetical protein
MVAGQRMNCCFQNNLLFIWQIQLNWGATGYFNVASVRRLSEPRPLMDLKADEIRGIISKVSDWIIRGNDR